MMDQPSFTSEFPVYWRTDRDCEIPVLREFIRDGCVPRHHPLSVLDIGAAHSADTYANELRHSVGYYEAVDLWSDPRVAVLVDNYIVGDVNLEKLTPRDLVICLSVIEHVGIKPINQALAPSFTIEQNIAFERCLELALGWAFISIPVGLRRVIPGEFSVIDGERLEKWEYRLRPYKWKERFFYSEGPQGGYAWREHESREFAVSRPYVDTIGNQSLAVFEVTK